MCRTSSLQYIVTGSVHCYINWLVSTMQTVFFLAEVRNEFLIRWPTYWRIFFTRVFQTHTHAHTQRTHVCTRAHTRNASTAKPVSIFKQGTRIKFQKFCIKIHTDCHLYCQHNTAARSGHMQRLITLWPAKLRSPEHIVTTQQCVLRGRKCDSACLQTLIWGAFAKLRKATISFVMSVRPSVRNNSAPTGRILMKIDICVFFENLSRKFKFH
jgi:hypothetical protein